MIADNQQITLGFGFHKFLNDGFIVVFRNEASDNEVIVFFLTGPLFKEDSDLAFVFRQIGQIKVGSISDTGRFSPRISFLNIAFDALVVRNNQVCMLGHDLFRILEIGLDWLRPFGPLPLQPVRIDKEFTACLMDTTSKRKDKSTNRISKNVKNRLLNLLFLSKLEGVGDSHHIIGNYAGWAKLRWLDCKAVDSLVVKMMKSFII